MQDFHPALYAYEFALLASVLPFGVAAVLGNTRAANGLQP